MPIPHIFLFSQLYLRAFVCAPSNFIYTFFLTIVYAPLKLYMRRALLAFSRAKKWHFERPDLRTESKNLAKHPPKWLGRHLGHAFPFSGECQAKILKIMFLEPFGALFTLLKGQNRKTAGRFLFMGL